jgi:hypothetical protein
MLGAAVLGAAVLGAAVLGAALGDRTRDPVLSENLIT